MLQTLKRLATLSASLLLLTLALPRTTQSQGFSLENFAACTTGAAPTTTCVNNSWQGTKGTGTGSVINNSTGGLTIVAPASSVCGPPPSWASGNILDYNTTIASGTSNQFVQINFPTSPAISTEQEYAILFCTNIPQNDPSFAGTFDPIVLSPIAGSEVSNYSCVGTSCNVSLENCTVFATPHSCTPIPMATGAWRLATFHYANGGLCADTTNLTDCVVYDLYDPSNWSFIGRQYMGTTGTVTAPSYITLGNVNQWGGSAGHHVQFMNLEVCQLGCGRAQFPLGVNPPPWAGIITPGRAIDYTQAGISGGIPSAGWPQCVTAACNTALSAGTAATTAQINAGLSSAPSNTHVDIAAGIYNFSTGQIQIPNTGHVALRALGSGADFVFSGSAGGSCNRSGSAFICQVDAANANPTGTPTLTWSAGYAQGATNTTLSSTAGIVTTASANPTMLYYNQCDTGLSGCVVITSASESGTSATYQSTLNPGVGVSTTIANVSPSGYNSPNCITTASSSSQFTCTLGVSGLGAGGSGIAATGTNADNGTLFIGEELYGSGIGCCGNGPGNVIPLRGQMEIHVASSASAGTAILTVPLSAPNWVSGQTPMVLPIQSVSMFGIENIRVKDPTVAATVGISFQNAYNWWITGAAVTDSNSHLTWGINCLGCANGEVQSSYVYKVSGNANPYGIRCMMCSYNLIDNNFVHQTGTPFSFDGSSSGNVVAYNFVPNATFFPSSNSMQAAFSEHAVHLLDYYDSNLGLEQVNDSIHGAANIINNFRNGYTGWWSQPLNPVSSTTNARQDATFSRYSSDTFGLYGSSIYHTAYRVSNSCTGVNAAIFAYGQNCAYGFIPTDALSNSTALRYGNFDTVTNAVRWCGNSLNTGFSTTCANASEAPAAAALLPNFIPTVGDTAKGQPAAPASFYFSTRPPWYSASIPFPAMGPDVTGGNLGQCGGAINTTGLFAGVPSTNASKCAGQSLNTLWGGHANAIPAVNCALNVLNMPVDGSGPVLLFNANACYVGGGGGIAATPTFSPLGGTYLSTRIVTITSTTAGATLCVTIDGTTPTANGAGTCTHGTTLVNGGTVSVSFTQLVQAVASESGLTDSGVGSARYTFSTSSPATVFAGMTILKGLVQIQ